MEDFIRKNYENPEKVIELYYSEHSKLENGFFKKYPLADIDKFSFQVDINKNGTLGSSRVFFSVDSISSFDVESKNFKNNPEYTKYLYSGVKHEPWPKIWSEATAGSKLEFTRLRFPKDPSMKCVGDKCDIPDDTQFQEPADLKQSLHNFRVYVNARDYFMSNLPHVYAKWSKGKVFDESKLVEIRYNEFDYKKEPYFAMICGAYIASYLSGISMMNLHDDHPLISTFVRYHFYFQIRKFMQNPVLIDKFDVSEVRKHIPIFYKKQESVGTDDFDGDHYMYRVAIEFSGTDYRSFIAYESAGLTVIGQKLFQESLESFNYSVLGAEARTRWSIVGKGAKSSQTQDVFKKIVEDTIIQSDTTVAISNMRASIQATNVVLNLALVPNVILMPSNFVILDKKIDGYNNILTTATEGMSFGINKNVNYTKPREPTDKTKPGGLLNNYFHNDADAGRGNSSNGDNNDNDRSDGVNVLFRKQRTSGRGLRGLGLPIGLPIVFFLSTAVGILASKKKFS